MIQMVSGVVDRLETWGETASPRTRASIAAGSLALIGAGAVLSSVSETGGYVFELAGGVGLLASAEASILRHVGIMEPRQTE